MYNCCLCGKMLSSFSSLDRHMLVHSGERPFSCEVCGQTFTTNGNMHRHRRTHNVRDSCESDGSGGSGAAAAKRARKRKSSTLGPLMEQQQQHSQSATANNSKISIDDSKYAGLKCPICPERFYSELSMEVHVINYHPGREIRCEDCGHPCPTYNYFKLHRNMFHFKTGATVPGVIPPLGLIGSNNGTSSSVSPPALVAPPPPPSATTFPPAAAAAAAALAASTPYTAN